MRTRLVALLLAALTSCKHPEEVTASAVPASASAVGSDSAVTNSPAASSRASNGLVTRYEGAHAVIDSESPIPLEQAKSFATRADAVYEALFEINAWSDDTKRQHLSKPFTIKVVSSETLKTKYPGVDGLTIGADEFIIGEHYFESPEANATLAHELTHLQDWRVGGLYPTVLSEARARTSASAYLKKTQTAGGKSRTGKSFYAKLTPEVARQALDFEAKEPPPGYDVVGKTGVCFYEYLRLHGEGHGIADLTEKMTRVAEIRGQKHEHLAPAWEEVFGTPLRKEINHFISFLEKTANDPAERVKGTMWESDAE
jgi:hypothetical protein